MRQIWRTALVCVVLALAPACGSTDGAAPAAGGGAGRTSVAPGPNEGTRDPSATPPRTDVSAVGTGVGTVVHPATGPAVSPSGSPTPGGPPVRGTGVEVQLLDLDCPPSGGPLTPCTMTPGRGVVRVVRDGTGGTEEARTGAGGTAVVRTDPGRYSVAGRSAVGSCRPLTVEVIRHRVVHVDLYCGDS